MESTFTRQQVMHLGECRAQAAAAGMGGVGGARGKARGREGGKSSDVGEVGGDRGCIVRLASVLLCCVFLGTVREPVDPRTGRTGCVGRAQLGRHLGFYNGDFFECLFDPIGHSFHRSVRLCIYASPGGHGQQGHTNYTKI